MSPAVPSERDHQTNASTKWEESEVGGEGQREERGGEGSGWGPFTVG